MSNLRNLVKKYKEKFSIQDNQIIKQLLSIEFNEERMLGLLFLVEFYKKNHNEVYEFYLENLDSVNNWNLVDCSAHLIIGKHLIKNNFVKEEVKKLAIANNMWHRRVAMVSLWMPIRKEHTEFYDLVIEIATQLLADKNDLIAKAVGWMIRELGKKNHSLMMQFLNENKNKMERITLRNIIEQFPIELRKQYLEST